MPGTVYTVASGKGGVGKTTTSVNLAVALWREGNAVALVDADIGMANLAAVLDLDPETTLHDVLAERATVEDAVIEAKDGDLLVLPGDRDLDGFVDADPDALGAVVDDLAERADYVIVDTGAGLSYEDVLPLGLADGVILVSTPDPAAFGDTRKTLEIAGLLGAPIRGLVVTRTVEDTDPGAIASEIGAELLGAVPEDPAVMASTVAGDPLESYAPDSDAAAAYRDLAVAVVEGDEGPEPAETPAREPADVEDEDGVGTVAAEDERLAATGTTSVDPGGDEADERGEPAAAEADEPAAAEADEPAAAEADEPAVGPSAEGAEPTGTAAEQDDASAPEGDASEPDDAAATEPAGHETAEPDDRESVVSDDAEAADPDDSEAADPDDSEAAEGDDTGTAEPEVADVTPLDEGPGEVATEDEAPESVEMVEPGDGPVETRAGDERDGAADVPAGNDGDDLSDVIANAEEAEAQSEEADASADVDEAGESAEADVDEASASAEADDEDATVASAGDEEESAGVEEELPEVEVEPDAERGGVLGWLGRLFS